MIAGILHEGSGLGNQLHRYIATRCIALDKGYDFGMVNPDYFKGSSFLTLDMGKEIEAGNYETFEETRINNEQGVDIRPYDERVKDIKNNTIIDGEFQDERYWEHHKIQEWLTVTPLHIEDNVCIIGFRGGEYQYFPDLFLTKKYWDDAIDHMLSINPDLKFKVVTDDPVTAALFFPDYEISHEIGTDWRSVRYAKYLILSNSSFFIFPAWLNKRAYIVAPKYWARHNLSFWALPQNIYKGWHYLDKEGTITVYENDSDKLRGWL